MTDLRMLGYRARLTIDLEDGPHDVSHLVETSATTDPGPNGFVVRIDDLIRELEIEKRARDRALKHHGYKAVR